MSRHRLEANSSWPQEFYLNVHSINTVVALSFMIFSNYCIHLSNPKTNLIMHGKCIHDDDHVIWLLVNNNHPNLIWIRKSDDLIISIDEYADEDYSSLNISDEWKEFISTISSDQSLEAL